MFLLGWRGKDTFYLQDAYTMKQPSYLFEICPNATALAVSLNMLAIDTFHLFYY